MNFEEVLKNVAISEIVGRIPNEIKGICDKSYEAEEGFLFIARKGSERDGREFVSEAVGRGATVVVSETTTETEACLVIVKDAIEAEAIIAENFYRSPQKNMKLIGVVGTNGKTTVCHLISSILKADGRNVGTIGTIGVYYGDTVKDFGLTSLGTIELYSVLREMADFGVETVTMEISAHAIDQKRMAGLYFEALIFTNCTEDHLDYFKTFEKYAAVKKSVFTDKISKYKIINSDDPLGAEMLSEDLGNCISYGIYNPADVFATEVTESVDGIDYVINMLDVVYELKMPLFGEYNVYNSLAACACAALSDVNIHTISGALKRRPPVSGRAEPVAQYNGATIFLDYAHTPDGLKRTLSSMRKICKGKLLSLFGCGGNREKEKRPLMGEISGILADYTILTSDNPRFEDPSSIIREIENGVRRVTKNYISIQDRKEAIFYAVRKLSEGDILLVAGKGAEKYQDILGVKREFSDKEVIGDVVSALGGDA